MVAKDKKLCYNHHVLGGDMIGFLLRWSINLLALVVANIVIDGIRIEGIGAGMLAAAVLGIVNAVIRPIVLILTLPVNVITLGLFTIVINAVMLEIVAAIVPGFSIETFGAAVIGALIVGIVSLVLNLFISGDGRVVYIRKVRYRP